MEIRLIETKVRGCGKRRRGLYVVGGTEGSKEGVLSRFTLIDPPVPYQVKPHRGPRIVDGFAILSRQSMDDWWIGSSRDTEEKKSADQWALDTFGMTLSRRLTIGECAHCGTADEALAVLVTQARLNTRDHRLVTYFQDMTRMKIQELPRVTVHYEQFHTSMYRYLETQAVDALMQAQAALWRMAYNIPPRKRKEFIPYLLRFLVLMNLTKDASAMQRTFMT